MSDELESGDACSPQMEASYIARFTSISFAVVSNLVAAAYTYYKLYKDGTKPPRASTIDNFVIYGTFIYICLATFIVFYNLFYRFIIEANHDSCKTSDIIDEWLIIFGRTYLLIFFTYRVEKVFKTSAYAVNTMFMNSFRIFVIAESFFVNAIWINWEHMDICIYESKFGVYCKNGGELAIILTHFGFESIFYLIILSIFVVQLTKVTKSIEDSMATGSVSPIATAVSPTTVATTATTNSTRTSTRQSTRKSTGHYSSKRSYGLIRIALRQSMFVFISIVSTWIFYLASVVNNGGDFYAVMRWLYPLDWTINVWCIVLMFSFAQFGAVFGRVCQCCTQFHKCHCLPQVWRDALKYYSDQRKKSSVNVLARTSTSPRPSSAATAVPDGTRIETNKNKNKMRDSKNINATSKIKNNREFKFDSPNISSSFVVSVVSSDNETNDTNISPIGHFNTSLTPTVTVNCNTTHIVRIASTSDNSFGDKDKSDGETSV